MQVVETDGYVDPDVLEGQCVLQVDVDGNRCQSQVRVVLNQWPD